MKKIMYAVVMASVACLFSFTLMMNGWKVKGDEAVVEFSGGRISGTIGGLKADIEFDKDHPETAKIIASVDAPSLATGFFIKTNHAKDALGVDKYPFIKFVSALVSKNGDAYLAKGSLTMKGLTRPATIHFTFEDKGNQGIFKGSFKVIPKEFGIDRSGTPDEVTVNLTVPVTRS